MLVAALGMCAVLSSPEELDLRAMVDQIRRDHGLPAVKINPSLQKAAEAHTRYMLANQSAGHAEEPGGQAFIGRTPGDRAKYFGYAGPNSEAVAWGNTGVGEMVRGLFDAPYHRVLFLQPKAPDFGAATAEGALCIKFGGDLGNGVVLSPINGARNVSCAWDGVESPDPLRKTNLKGPVGFPILLTVFGKDAKEFRSVNASMVGPGGPVAAIVLNPASDTYAGNAIILIPVKPLAKATNYTVTFNYANASGQKTAQTTFSTMR